MASSNPYRTAPRVLLNNNNYHVWSTLVESKLDNIGCIDVTTEGASNLSLEKEKKGYHLMVCYLSKELLGYLSNVIKPDEKGKGSVAWNLLKKAPESLQIILQMEPIPSKEDVLKRIEKDQLQFNGREKNTEALFTKKPYKKNYNNSDKKKRVNCYKCNKLGHIAKDSKHAMRLWQRGYKPHG
ncbi:hypothetical protein MJO29_016245 [Puccinia striiformis f. sp. tritici]|nr:hypothetical protein MJO29_016245 [Puccinia striiformis f. sp. tritici]